MTGFCAIYTGILLRHTMKFTSFSISDVYLNLMQTKCNCLQLFVMRLTVYDRTFHSD